VSLLALLVLTSCFGEALPGSTVRHRRSLSFYMATSASGYVKMTEADYGRILAGAQWDLGEGLELVDADLSLSPTKVTWTEFDTKYTAEGAKLSADVRVKVAENAQPGWLGIRLQLPGLLSYGRATNSGASFPGEGPGFTIHDGFTVAGVTVHESAGARNLAVLKKLGLFAGVGLVCLLILWLVFRPRR
jgi:hypothetical protein